ncbi:MAG: flagella basal body P-ring formation protein FlgA [Sulfuricurvum sp.]
MIKSIFLILFVFISVIQGGELSSNYFFENPLIMSKTIDLECEKNFEILRIPDGKTSYRINAQIIAKTFELGGCQIASKKVRFVNFIKKNNTDYPLLKEQVILFFKHHYPTIEIQEIHIFPHGYSDSLPAQATVIFEDDAYKNKKGTFYVFDTHGLRRYFDFSINATLSTLHTSRKVTRKEVVSLQNTVLKSLSFETFRGKPLIILPETPSRFRASLQEGAPILDRHIEQLPMVLRGSRVSATIQNGSVIVEFIAHATQEGRLYDIITIQKADGKRARAKIMGENRVELQ